MIQTFSSLKVQLQEQFSPGIPVDKFGPQYCVQVSDQSIGMKGYLVIDNTALGPGKGGVRMTPTVTLGEVYRLARTMTWKNALVGIPFGGAKGGMVWDGGSDELKKKHVQAFASALKPFIPHFYITGPDVSSGEKEMQWIAETLGVWEAATGKPASYCEITEGGRKKCGLPHEYGSTGFGVAHAARVIAELLGMDFKKTRIAIEGFGNVGSFVFKFLKKWGAQIIAVSDSGGTAVSHQGFDEEILHNIKREKKSVSEYAGAQKLSRDSIFGLDVDILIPASVTDVINEHNKNTIRAKVLVEGANIPMRENIENELMDRGIVIVPDFVANSGGVISSYAEYRGFSPEEMFELVEEKVVLAVRTVMSQSIGKKRNPRQVALEIAQNKVREAMQEKMGSGSISEGIRA